MSPKTTGNLPDIWIAEMIDKLAAAVPKKIVALLIGPMTGVRINSLETGLSTRLVLSPGSSTLLAGGLPEEIINALTKGRSDKLAWILWSLALGSRRSYPIGLTIRFPWLLKTTRPCDRGNVEQLHYQEGLY